MTERLAAFCQLLALPDPQGMRRGHRVTWPGDEGRRETVLASLVVAWLQYRHVSVDSAPMLQPAKKWNRYPVRLLRRA